jgi:ubiquitin C-terminal hydrolase
MVMMIVMLMAMMSMCCTCGRLCYMYIIVIVLYLSEGICSMYLGNVVLNFPQFASPRTSTSGSWVAVFCIIDACFGFSSTFIGLVFVNFAQFVMFCGEVVIAQF